MDSDTQTCQHPKCNEESTESYADAHGNELKLCSEHYFEAVHPSYAPTTISRVVKSESERSGNPLTRILK